MKKPLTLVALSLALQCFAQKQPHTPVSQPVSYGASTTFGNRPLSVTQVQNKLNRKKQLTGITVKGKVTEVCQAKGCWLTLLTSNQERFFIRTKDHAYFVPKDLAGKTVILKGNAERITVPAKELKHYAEDAGKTPAEINAITKDRPEIRFVAEAVKVVNS
ncbi:DUF4920 domain-containing protein [Bergeyella sp. RCAD1439]|uniref:DUF4920 domain-containing protein n=1 Tax=Bergeyella anatis TaxID=3113737 RepID=UPI002E19B6F8|nr:DUF4920 domain-containing protein [Bergeyella sp. RCAD1439]